MSPSPNLSSIYAAGISIVSTSAAYNPGQQQKTWTRPLQPNENPSDDYVFQYAVANNSYPAPYVQWLTAVMTKAAAEVANVPPPGYAAPAGLIQVPGAVPIPMDETLIPSGYTLTGTPFGLVFAANDPSAPAPAPSGLSPTDPVVMALGAGINAILASLGKPPIVL